MALLRDSVIHNNIEMRLSTVYEDSYLRMGVNGGGSFMSVWLLEFLLPEAKNRQGATYSYDNSPNKNILVAGHSKLIFGPPKVKIDDIFAGLLLISHCNLQWEINRKPAKMSSILTFRRPKNQFRVVGDQKMFIL